MVWKIYRKIRRNIEDYGLFISLKKSFLYLLRPIYDKKHYRVYKIDLDNLHVPLIENNFHFKILDNDDHHIVNEIEKVEEWLSGQVRSLVGSQGLCIVALEKNELAGFNLISFGETFIPAIQMTKTLQPDEAWSQQITVRKGYRRRGLGSQLRYKAFEELKQRGIRKFYGGTLPENEASLKLARKVGFRDMGVYSYHKLLIREKWRYKEI